MSALVNVHSISYSHYENTANHRRYSLKLSSEGLEQLSDPSSSLQQDITPVQLKTFGN